MNIHIENNESKREICMIHLILRYLSSSKRHFGVRQIAEFNCTLSWQAVDTKQLVTYGSACRILISRIPARNAGFSSKPCIFLRQPPNRSKFDYLCMSIPQEMLDLCKNAGMTVGIVTVFLLSSHLCLVQVDNGWPFIFYATGEFQPLLCNRWMLKH